MNNQPEKFKGVIQLLKESFLLYQKKAKTLLGIMAILVLINFLGEVLLKGLSATPIRYSLLFSFIEVGISLISLFLWLLAIPSLIFAIKENIGIKEAYKKGLKISPSFLWVYFLYNAISLGGFLLFIIPGVLFFIWFSLAIFFLVFEEKKGMNALLKSQHIISGKFWGILRRYLSLGLIILIFIIIVFTPPFFLLKENKVLLNRVIDLLGYVSWLFITPLFLIYGVLVYKNLEKIKGGIPYQEPIIKRKLKYLLPAILGTFVFLITISFSFMNIFLGRDEPPPYDGDLWLTKIEIPKEENAFYYFLPYCLRSEKEIFLEKYWPEEKDKFKEKEIYLPKGKEEFFREMSKGEKWDQKLAKDLIENNKEIFNVFEKVIQTPYYQNPAFQNPTTIGPETPLLSLNCLIDIARLNSVKVAYLFNQGQEKEAFDLSIKILKLGQMLEESPRPVFIEYLIGMAIKQLALKQMKSMISKTSLPPKILKNYLKTLSQFEASKEGLTKIFKMEYASFFNTKKKIDAAIAGKLSKEELRELEIGEISFPAKLMPNYFYKPNRTQRMFVEYYREAIGNVNKNWDQIKFIEVEPFVYRSKIKMLFTENILGKILREIIMVSFENTFKKKCEEDFLVRGTQLLLAIKAYQIEKGKIPISLNELIPDYISEIPKDPFDGQPIRYSPEKKTIYSVSEDLKDNGGEEGDILFEIEF